MSREQERLIHELTILAHGDIDLVKNSLSKGNLKGSVNFILDNRKSIPATLYNIRVGDSVKVIKKVDREEGWNEEWVEDMDEYIGKKCKIIDFNGKQGILLAHPSKPEAQYNTFHFPFSVVLKL